MNPWNSSPSPAQPYDAEPRPPDAVLRFPGSLPQQPEDREPLAQQDQGDYPPVIVVFSPAGSTGETSIVANLGRALALQGEEVLLLDAPLQENLAHYFGAGPPSTGKIRTVYDPGSNTCVRLAQLPMARHDPGGDGDRLFRDELAALIRDCDRIIIDLSTASPLLIWQIFSLSPLLLVPMLPGWNAMLSVPVIDRLLQQVSRPSRLPIQPKFLLTEFDPEASFHRTVLEELRNRVGVRLLPLVLHRNLDVDEALARGETVFDPDTRASQDYRALAAWIRSRFSVTRPKLPCVSVAKEAS
jgi:cellulose biosynthesis protein BcsQ